ncbi:EamA family transporter [Paenibacillus polymyxa]|uniref:EamA family transporter n=1 Tax=Paenibacillus polymyxa TaxID=1406 RepID=UPI00398C9CB0
MVSSVLSFIFWNAGIREIGASRAGVYMNFITVFTAIMSVAMGIPCSCFADH